MKLLVLGGSGLVGKSLLKSNNEKFDIIATYNENQINVPKILSLKCTLPSDFDKLEETIRNEKPEIIVNAMGYSNIDFCEANKEKSYQLHVKITEKIAKLVAMYDIKTIFLSSDYVFDGKKGNYTESDIPNPINYYGETKLEAEKIILKQPQNVVFRTSIIYDWDFRVRFFNYVINNLKNQKEIEVTYDVFNSVTIVDSLIQSIFLAIEKDISGLFHIVDSTCVNRFEFAKCIAKIFKLDNKLIKKVSIDDIGVIAKRPKNTCLNNSKAEKSLGIKFGTLEDGVKQVLNKTNQK
ncbi:MAG: SDR family oxidoreductase [Nanoarchaeota archaeon]